MRGVLSGGVWGVLVGGISISVASLVAEQPAGNVQPDQPQIAAPAVAEVQEPVVTTPAEPVPDPQTTAQSAAPRVETPDPVSDVPTADTTPAAQPSLAAGTDAMTAPDAGDEPQISAAAEEPVIPNPQSIAPQLPVAEEDIVVATRPAEPLIIVEEPPAAVVVADAPDVADAAPIIGTSDVTTPATSAPQAAPDDTVAVTLAPDALVVDTPEVTPTLVQDPPAAAPTDTPDADAVASVDDTAGADALPQTSAGVGSDQGTGLTATGPAVVTIIGEPAGQLPTTASGIQINRPATAADVADPVVEEAPALPDDAPATLRYAALAENPEGKPSVAVVLIDDGSFAASVPALTGIPFPVTVMLNPAVPDAASKMAAYRAAGIEVGVLATLPEGATPADVAIFFEAAFDTLPETVAVLDASPTGLQADNEVFAQTVAALAEDGRGLVTLSQGFNAGLRTADAAGVPAAIIFSDLDSEGQDATVIRRFMDQAAFRARQESGVVVLGRVRADTISALILWGAANRAGQVALLPLTAVFAEK